MAIQNVLLVGAGGRLGQHLLEALVKAAFAVTILTRASSTSEFPPDITVARVADDYPYDALVQSFKGHDAVVCAISAIAVDLQASMIAAAAEAGVQRFIPSEFGSDLDAKSDVLPLFASKTRIIQHLQSTERTGLTWTAISCGLFFEFGLQSGLMHIDIVTKKATVLDSGDAHFSASTWRTIGAAAVGVLKNPEKTKNRVIYVQSFSTTQNELRRAMGRASGAEIEVEKRLDSREFVPEQEKRVKEGDRAAIFWLIWAMIVSGSDWNTKLDNDLLEVPQEDIGAVIDSVVHGMQTK